VLEAVIGNYKIVSLLGKGGMGEVWRAEHTTIGTRVAIKTLRGEISEEKTHVDRFFNEALIVGKIRHAGIATVFDVGRHDGRAYIMMELLEGDTLAQRLRKVGRLPMSRVCEIGRQIASVLEATHDAGITHRDLKPDNIFLVKDSEAESGERVKILDFGIAKLGGGVGLTSTSMGSMGTPLYMSPEQWRSVAKVDWRTDAYSLGCVAFEMAIGHPPFQAQSMGEACAKHLTEAPPIPSHEVPGLPAGFDVLVNRLLDKEPTRRPNMRDVQVAFEAIGEDREIDLGETSIPTLGGVEAMTKRESAMAATLISTSESKEAVATLPTMAITDGALSANTPTNGGAKPDTAATRAERPSGQRSAPDSKNRGPSSNLRGQPSSGARAVPPPAPPSSSSKLIMGGIAVGGLVIAGSAYVIATRPDELAQLPPDAAVVVVTPDAAPPIDAAIVQVPIDAPGKPTRIVGVKQMKRLKGDVPEVTARVAFELCVDEAGAVTHVVMFDGVAPDVAKRVEPVLRTWTYKPYVTGGAAAGVCFNDAIAPKKVVAVTPAGEDRSQYPDQPNDQDLQRVISFADFRIDQCGTQFSTETVTVRVALHVDGDGHVDKAEPTPFSGIGQCVAFALRGNSFPRTKAGFSYSYSRGFTATKKDPPPAANP
jgi:serine/threonine-protein kinase